MIPTWLKLIWSPKPLRRGHRLLTRHWCPDWCYLRVGPVILQVARRLLPYADDGVGRCHYCGREKWMRGGPNMACQDCIDTLRCIETKVKGPPWWPERLHQAYRAATGNNWGKSWAEPKTRSRQGANGETLVSRRNIDDQ